MRKSGSKGIGATLTFLGVVVATGVLWVRPAEAQVGFALDQYRAAETPEDGFAISRPNDLGHIRFGAQFHLDYAYNPLVWEDEQGEPDTQSLSLVSHQMVMNVGAAAGFFNRLVVYLGLPINLWMTGEDPVPNTDNPETPEVDNYNLGDESALGDLYLGARVRIYGDNDDVFGLGAQVTMTFPMASWVNENQYFSGEQNFSGHIEVLAEVRPGPVAITANVGFRLREGADYDTFSTNHELTYGLGVTYRPIDMLEIMAEGYGASVFSDVDVTSLSNPLEVIGGVRIHPGMGFVIGVAGGAGLIRGAGSPAARGILTFGWRQLPPAEPECPDADDDRICDADDQCANEPEDYDNFQDEDGCPDPDNDQDGILDGVDGPDGSCMNDPEDRDGFQDEDGCPDPDNDQDGILDGVDGPNGSCMNDPEDRDGFEDEDGCPDPDNDQDTVLDPVDQCPLIPGPPELNGCPPQVESGARITILDRIQFANDSDELHRVSIPILENVSEVLRNNPAVLRIRIEGHTDSNAADDYNMDLSRRRAARVVEWLSTTGGISVGRMQPHACGETNPIDSNETNTGRLQNRRVEFHIIDPAPPGGVRTPCTSQPRSSGRVVVPER
jgi:outer membrane protein OmpA-like peptidoglycan-associated protein